MRVTVANGKYTVVMEGDGRLHALRHGQPWPARDLVGDNFVLCLASDLDDARSKLAQCVRALKLAQAFGSQGDTDEGLSVSEIIRAAIERAS